MQKTFYCLLAFLWLFSLPLWALPSQEEGDSYDGKIIRNIYVDVRNIFEEENLAWLYNQANKGKFSTQEQVVLRELVFKSGETITPFLVKESARNLRSLRYLRKINIRPKIINAKEVDVYVEAQDTWTLIPQISFSSGDGRNKRTVGIADSNVLGLGKRLEFLFIEDDGKETFKTIYDDRRFLGSDKQLITAFFDRKDGEKAFFSLNKPFRTLVDKYSYGAVFNYGDTAERLFRNGNERYIYREDLIDIDLHYTFAKGNPEEQTRRFSFGYEYADSDFSDASAEDFEDLNIDPDSDNLEEVTLPADRRFSGPYFAIQAITPEYISRNYIDRFDRLEDYNLGTQYSARLQYAPEFFGSLYDSFLASASIAKGYAFSQRAFLRGELGTGSRYQEGGFQNTKVHSELRYYNVLGNQFIGDTFLGRHTLAAGLTLDYAHDLDRDEEHLLGADNFLRAYEARTLSGDKRLVLNLEDRVHLYDDLLQLFSLGAVLFLDVGTASKSNFKSMIFDELYSDVGVGLRLAFPRSSGSRVVRLDMAFPLRTGPDGSKAGEPRFLISVSQVFDSFLQSEILQKQSPTIDTGF